MADDSVALLHRVVDESTRLVDGVTPDQLGLPFGEMPAGVALNIAVMDVATHSCDIARATGQKVTDAGLYEAALAMGRRMITDDFRQPGVFDVEQPCAADAPVEDRLLAFAGRRI